MTLHKIFTTNTNGSNSRYHKYKYGRGGTNSNLQSRPINQLLFIQNPLNTALGMPNWVGRCLRVQFSTMSFSCTLGVYAFVILKDGVTDPEDEIIKDLQQLVRTQIGGFAVPQSFLVSWSASNVPWLSVIWDNLPAICTWLVFSSLRLRELIHMPSHHLAFDCSTYVPSILHTASYHKQHGQWKGDW